MTHEDFDRVIRQQIHRTTGILLKKQEEYATDDDRLHNFHAGSGLTGRTPEQVCGGFLLKHIISIFDMIEDGIPHDLDIWNEKISDAINYLLLLRAIVEDEVVDWDEIVFKKKGKIVRKHKFGEELIDESARCADSGGD